MRHLLATLNTRPQKHHRLTVINRAVNARALGSWQADKE